MKGLLPAHSQNSPVQVTGLSITATFDQMTPPEAATPAGCCFRCLWSDESSNYLLRKTSTLDKNPHFHQNVQQAARRPVSNWLPVWHLSAVGAVVLPLCLKIMKKNHCTNASLKLGRLKGRGCLPFNWGSGSGFQPAWFCSSFISFLMAWMPSI